MNPMRVLFSFNLIVSKLKALVIDAVKPDAGAALHDQIVGDYLIRERAQWMM